MNGLTYDSGPALQNFTTDNSNALTQQGLQSGVNSGGITVNSQGSTPIVTSPVTTPPPPAKTTTTAPYSGDSQLQQLAKTDRNPVQEAEYQRLLAAQNHGPSQDDINNQINDTYNASNQYLDQAEAAANADNPTNIADVQGQYDTSLGQLNTTNQGAQQQFATQGQNLNQSNETALAASRRLYSELNQGYNQRFGGATSAGDAAHELANVAQQRAQGQQNVSYQQAQQQINNNKAQTDAQYQQNVLALQTSRDQSLNQANRDFQNKLLTISQSRAQNEQAKGQAKLQALQDLRNQIFAINQQNTQFQQTLEAQRQDTANKYALYSDLANKGVDTSSQALADFQSKLAGAQQPNLQVGGSSGQADTTYTGSTGKRIIGTDSTGQPIYG